MAHHDISWKLAKLLAEIEARDAELGTRNLFETAGLVGQLPKDIPLHARFNLAHELIALAGERREALETLSRTPLFARQALVKQENS